MIQPWACTMISFIYEATWTHLVSWPNNSNSLCKFLSDCLPCPLACYKQTMLYYHAADKQLVWVGRCLRHGRIRVPFFFEGLCKRHKLPFENRDWHIPSSVSPTLPSGTICLPVKIPSWNHTWPDPEINRDCRGLTDPHGLMGWVFAGTGTGSDAPTRQFSNEPKNSPNGSEMTRYDLNSQRTPFYSYLSQFSTVLAVFGLVLTGWVDTGAGAGQAELPMGYPRQSLEIKREIKWLSEPVIWWVTSAQRAWLHRPRARPGQGQAIFPGPWPSGPQGRARVGPGPTLTRQLQNVIPTYVLEYW